MYIGSELKLLNVCSYIFDFLIVIWFSPINSVCWVFYKEERKIFVFLLSRWFGEWVRHAFAAWTYIIKKKKKRENT